MISYFVVLCSLMILGYCVLMLIIILNYLAREMAECARQLVLEPYFVLRNVQVLTASRVLKSTSTLFRRI